MKKKMFIRRESKQDRADDNSLREPYYEGISARLGIFQVILYLTLLAFVVLSVVRNSTLITYRNFYYFFKDLDASAEGVDVLHNDSVTYPTARQQSFTLYRGGLAVAGNSSVTVFTATGRQTVSQTVSYQNPIAEGRGKYLLVYEMGGTQYSLYNSYTQVTSEKSDYPINGAAVSDSGMYALLSSSEEHTSLVSLYSSNFSLLGNYRYTGYVTDLSFNADGSLLAIVTAHASGAGFQTSVELYTPGKDTQRAKTELPDSLMLSCGFTQAGILALLSTEEAIFLDSSGKIVESYSFDGFTPVSVEMGRDGPVLALQDSEISEKNRIIVFDKNGKMMYNNDVLIKTDELRRNGDAVYIKTLDGIQRLEISTGELSAIECHTEQRRILAVGENEVLLCTPQKAEYIRFS